MFDEYCLGVDVSHWQAAVDWTRLAQAGVQFAIVKVSQSSYGRDPCRTAHLKNAAAAGLICGVYHWFDPGVDPQAQLKNLEYALAGLDFQFMALDVEQYWREWELSLRAEKSNHFSDSRDQRQQPCYGRSHAPYLGATGFGLHAHQFCERIRL